MNSEGKLQSLNRKINGLNCLIQLIRLQSCEATTSCRLKKELTGMIPLLESIRKELSEERSPILDNVF